MTEISELIPEANASDLNSTDVLHRFTATTEVVQQMNKTNGFSIGSPVNLIFTDPIISTYNATWQYREHNRDGNASGLMVVLDCNSVTPEIECEDNAFGIEMLDLLDTTRLPAIEAVGSDWYFFKTFESPDPIFWDDIRINLTLETRIENATGDDTLLNSTLRIYDGAYDRRSNTDFPDGQPIPLKGAGILRECDFRQGDHGETGLSCLQPSINLFAPFINSTTGFITLMLQREQCDLCGGHTRIEEIDIVDVMKWDFEFGANVINVEVENTTGDHGTVTANSFTLDDPTEGRFDIQFTEGFAIDPTDNLIYGILKPRADRSEGNRALGLVNHVTGTVEFIGMLPSPFTALAFKHDGELRAVCNGSCERLTQISPPLVKLFDPQDYVAINKTTAKVTDLCNTGLDGTISNFGFTLAQDKNTETMIISGGNNFFGFDPVVRSIDSESTCALTTITVSGFDVGSEEDVGAMDYHTGDDVFYGLFSNSADSPDFFTQNTTGFRTQIAFDPFSGIDHKGLGFFYDIGDVVAPVITVEGNDPEFVDQFTTYVDSGAICLDNFDGFCTGSIVTVNPVDTNLAQQFIVTYDFQDSSGNDALQGTRTVNVLDKEAPVVTILGQSPIEVIIGSVYVDDGATATDNIDGDVTGSIITTNPVNTSIVDSYFVLYDVTDSSGNAGQGSRTVLVVSAFSVGGGGGGQSPVQNPIAPLSLVSTEEFEEALANALAEIEFAERTPLEQIVQTFFEFIVVDKSHDQLFLNSFLPNERLGLRWSTGQDIVIVSAEPAPSPFLINFEQFPVIKRGSGAVVSTSFLNYNLSVPTLECGEVIDWICSYN